MLCCPEHGYVNTTEAPTLLLCAVRFLKTKPQRKTNKIPQIERGAKIHVHYGIWCWSLLALEWTPIFTSQFIVFSMYLIVGVGVTRTPQSTNWSGRVLQAISSVMYNLYDLSFDGARLSAHIRSSKHACIPAHVKKRGEQRSFAAN